jgi:hypothetical protein
MDKYPDVQFYDYTKLHSNKAIRPNHHLTYSSTGVSQPAIGIHNAHQNWKHMTARLDEGQNVAMPFTVGREEALPEFVLDKATGKKYKVIDGDIHDYRPGDEWDKAKGADGVVVGLRFKGPHKLSTEGRKAAAKGNTPDAEGFFVYYEPSQGNTVEIAAQTARGSDKLKVAGAATVGTGAFLMQYPHWEDYNPELGKELSEQNTVH